MASGAEDNSPRKEKKGTEELKQIISPAVWCFFPIDLPFDFYWPICQALQCSCGGTQFTRASRLVFPLRDSYRNLLIGLIFLLSLLIGFAGITERLKIE